MFQGQRAGPARSRFALSGLCRKGSDLPQGVAGSFQEQDMGQSPDIDGPVDATAIFRSTWVEQAAASKSAGGRVVLRRFGHQFADCQGSWVYHHAPGASSRVMTVRQEQAENHYCCFSSCSVTSPTARRVWFSSSSGAVALSPMASSAAVMGEARIRPGAPRMEPKTVCERMARAGGM